MTSGWSDTLLGDGDPSARWQAIFDAVTGLVDTTTSRSLLERQLEIGDRLLAEAAWDLWQEYANVAPRASTKLRDFWEWHAGPTGRAVLILDALSVRELWTIVRAGTERGVPPAKIQVFGAEVPTTTNAFAHALGLSDRAQMSAKSPPAAFVLPSTALATKRFDDIPFEACVGLLEPKPDLVLWHPWLDDLIHNAGGYGAGPSQVENTTETVLHGDGFWALVDALRQRRELVITSDHGYAVSSRFVELPASLGQSMRAAFKAQREAPAPDPPISMPALPPLYAVYKGQAAAVGPWKWTVPGGFPHLAHGGLTLGEVCVPFIRFAAR